MKKFSKNAKKILKNPLKSSSVVIELSRETIHIWVLEMEISKPVFVAIDNIESSNQYSSNQIIGIAKCE